jgi:two-component system NtrC family sensor kinase
VHFGAARGALPDTEQFVRQQYPMRPNRETSLLGRSLLERIVVTSPDVQAEADPQLREYARKRGFHGELVVPLLRDAKVEGALVLTRAEPGPFTQREIALVQTFADQAVIAIQNVRMFTEVQARTRDLSEALDQQTATANVLKVISRSAFDLQAVFDTLISSAVELSGASGGTICLRDGDGYRYLATSGMEAGFKRFLLGHPPTPGLGGGASVALRQCRKHSRRAGRSGLRLAGL